MAGKPKDDDRPIIIVKRVKKMEGGHHGGAWKVAYADFVTAMMSFFLLLWLLNVTTDEQKMLISSYFSPADPRVATSTSGAGGVMGGTSLSPVGAMTTDLSPVMAMQQDPAEGVGRQDGEDGAKRHDDTQTPSDTEEEAAKQHEQVVKAEQHEKEDKQTFQKVQDALQKAIEGDPDLRQLKQHLLVDMTPEGLRIQIVDQEGKPMFELGSAKPLPAAEKLFALVTKVIEKIPNKISVRGHTDSKPYGKDAVYTNWELSSDRANAARRAFLTDGLDIKRIEDVQGRADRDLLVPADPESARNRRISIILLKQSIAKVDAPAPSAIPPAPEPQGPELKKREQGVIYFP